jgi:hypothetical protein
MIHFSKLLVLLANERKKDGIFLPYFALRILPYKGSDNQLNVVVGANMKGYRNKWQTTAGQSQLG